MRVLTLFFSKIKAFSGTGCQTINLTRMKKLLTAIAITTVGLTSTAMSGEIPIPATNNASSTSTYASETGNPDDPFDEGPTYYIIGTNVNGKQWELADPDGKFTKTSEGIYEWTGTTLGTGFKINTGEWTETNNFGTSGDGIILGEEFGYYDYNISDNMYFLEGTLLKNPKVVLNINRGTILVTGEVSGAYKWYASGTFNDFQISDETELTAVQGSPYTYKLENLPIQGEGYIRITSDGFTLQYGSRVEGVHITDPTGTYMLEKVPVNLGPVSYALDGTYTLVWDIRDLMLTMTRTGDFVDTPDDPVTPDPTHATVTVKTVNGINSSMTVPFGTSMTIGHDLDEYWRLKSLFVNGKDHSNLVTDNVYATAPISEDVTIECEIEYAGLIDVISEDSGIHEIAGSNLTISIENRQIVIRGLNINDEVVIYNTAGMRIFSDIATGDTMTIKLPESIAYIARVNDKAVKVRL